MVAKATGERESGMTAGSEKSWQTSHLPRLGRDEIRGVLTLMRGWYDSRNIEFARSCNWPLLWEYIDRNGLGGVLGAAVIDKLCRLPEPIEQAAVHRYFSTQLHYEQAYQKCLLLARTAANLQIGLRIMKGPALVLQGYDDPGVRPFSDIDVFIDDRRGIERLRQTLHGRSHKSSEQQGIIERLGESEVAGFFLGELELEFRYPIDPPGEPMFEILAAHRHSLLVVPGTPEEILSPDPSLHLVFLIQHMALHHLFSRFFWFLDLGVLVRKSGEAIDFGMVAEELQRLGLGNSAAAASRFCRKHLDPQFPELCRSRRCWNTVMLENFTAPARIADGRYGIYHRRPLAKILSYIVGMTSFYLVADPVKGSVFGFGTNWTLNRFRHSFGVKKPIRWVDFLLRPMIALVLLPLAWLVTKIETKKLKGCTDD